MSASKDEREFLWQGMEESFLVVNLGTVFLHKDQGGIGIGPLRKLIDALLVIGTWPWRLRDKSEGLLEQIHVLNTRLITMVGRSRWRF